MTLGSDTNHYFLHVILQDKPEAIPPEIRSHRRLAEAREHFLNHLSTRREELGAGYPEFLGGLFRKVAHHLKLIPYEVDDAADVGVIFEVMNDRGRPLSELEKAKNYLLYMASKLSQHGSLADQVNATLVQPPEKAHAGGTGTIHGRISCCARTG